MTTEFDKQALREDAIVEAFRQHLREAFRNRAVGEMNYRLIFQDGGLRSQRIGMKVEYEFVANTKKL